MFDGGQVRKKKKKKKDYFDVLAAHVGRRRAPQMVSPFLTEKKIFGKQFHSRLGLPPIP